MRTALTLLLVATLAAPAVADAPDLMGLARKHYEAGRALYELGKFEQAIVEFDEGYRLAPRPSFLVNIAQCDRQLGRVEHAREMYEKFLAAAPIDDPMRADVKRLLASMPAPAPRPAGSGAAVAAASPQASAGPPAPSLASPSAATATARADQPRRSPWRDPTGATLLAGGIAAVAAGVVLLGLSGYRFAHARDSYDDYLAARAAPDERTAGLVVLSAGVALGAGAAARFVVVRRATLIR